MCDSFVSSAGWSRRLSLSVELALLAQVPDSWVWETFHGLSPT